MSKSYVSSLSYSAYGYGSDGSGHLHFHAADGTSITFTLDEEDKEKLKALAFDIVNRKKEALAEQVRNVETPALLGYDRDKTIESEASFDYYKEAAHDPKDDDIPF